MDGDIAARQIVKLEAFDEQIALPNTKGSAGATLKLDQCFRFSGHLVFLGWCSDPAIEFQSNVALHLACFRYPRPDVNAALAQASDLKLGFCLIVPETDPVQVELSVGGVDVVLPLESTTIKSDLPQVPDMQADLFATFSSLSSASPLWDVCRAMLIFRDRQSGLATGALDHVLGSMAGSVFAGWVIHDKRTMVWLETPDGQPVSLKNAYWHDRPDVRNHKHGEAILDPKIGFVCETTQSGSEFRLLGASSKGVFEIASKRRKSARGTTAKMAEQLFAINTPRLDLISRFEQVDLPYLNRFDRHASIKLEDLPQIVRSHGQQIESPEISVVVPLYGRLDFMEHQLLAFCKDEDFVNHVEVIYVLDDPTLDMPLKGLEPILHKLTRCAFRTVSNGRNGGFARACNLGASNARGSILMFVNSDVFPRHTGWATGLSDVLKSNEDIGIVSPRLLFPDGGLQHAGMVPIWREALGIWSNHHPQMGFDPALDAHHTLSKVPLVSGACVALRKRDFDAVQGWTEDYLIGDYEDSDLCLKLRELGMASAYAPEIEMTHIERQSLPLSGEANFREYVTLLNGFRYSRRWHSVLKELAT